ncbi:uncharacterized protein LOC102806580 [Saccoglossus kowalevskii]|uniref:Uncharacterized protein LOC102806580 n=1 Tax=Saccoglossus kowalevskii TaxID=10224 RepID=A0ABM0MYB9_SACKO|nr:PREDICTED: uncharacterized protein LOC102806580 [Saccoglossus kowalevskii]
MKTVVQLEDTHYNTVSVDENNHEKSLQTRLLDTLTSFADAWLSIIPIGSILVAFWWGTWLTMGVVLPPNEKLSSWLSLSIGFGILLLVTPMQRLIATKVTERTMLWYIIPRVYLYVFSVATVNLWRGTWGVIISHVGDSFSGYIVVVAVSYITLCLFRLSYTLVTAPLVMDLDLEINYYCIKPRFGDVKDFFPWVLGLVVTFGLHAFVASSWLGVWTVLDFCLFPGDKLTSAYTSLCLAGGLCMVTLILGHPLTLLSHRIENFVARLVIEDVWNIIRHITVVLLWRGFWLLYDLYIFPDYPAIGFVLFHCTSAIFMTHMMCGFLLAAASLNCYRLDGDPHQRDIYQMPAYIKPLVSTTPFSRNKSEVGSDIISPIQYVIGTKCVYFLSDLKAGKIRFIAD